MLFLLCGWQQSAFATIEEVKLPSGYTATADYRKGSAELPAVLVLHGFLSTRNFLTVSNLIESLASDQYTVLAPNLSLGVNKRKISLACEAIHTHSLDQDIEEIDVWVKWLEQRGHNRIILIGHSYGSLHGLLYALKHPSPKLIKLIAASLVDVEHVIGTDLSSAQIKTAENMITNNDNGLREYQVSYCKKYVAPPKAFLSYATWSQKRILDAILKLSTPLEIILGEKDKRMGDGWPDMLANSGVNLKLIPGANHFFHNEQEFDLLESVTDALNSVQ